MSEIFQVNAGMIEFWQNITLNLVIAVVTVLSWGFAFPKSGLFFSYTQEVKRWKRVLYKIMALVGTFVVIVKTWFFFGPFPPLVTTAGLLALVWFLGGLLIMFVSWLFEISDEEWDKVLKFFL